MAGHESERNISFLGEGENKSLLGGKGAGLSAMVKMGLPVPPGFTITIDMCRQYYENGQKLPTGLMTEVRKAITTLEQMSEKKLGDKENPLLISVRSGAAVSMPGMMDTVLNLGLNDETVGGLISLTRDARFAYDSYRRFVQLFGKIVLQVDEASFERRLTTVKEQANVSFDHELGEDTLRMLVTDFKKLCREKTGKDFPDDPYTQLQAAIEAVFRSWMGKRAVDYRREFKITPEMADGTAVNIVVMVFGNLGNDSATGVIFTRDPVTGDKKLYGDYLINAQGEDIVAGIRNTQPIRALESELPESYRQLDKLAKKLEDHYKEPQDVEFTIEKGKLYLLQTRAAKMNALGVIRSTVSIAKKGSITQSEAIQRVTPEHLEQVLHRRVDPLAQKETIAHGVPASPGAAAGTVVFDADEAERQAKRGTKVILVREETKPEDIHGFFAAEGVLTTRGGKTSHAAVVARGMGKACVCGCSNIVINSLERFFKTGDKIIREGDSITVDGTAGTVYLGQVPTVEPEITPEMDELLGWADQVRRLGIRANADTPESATLARRLGAEGIGLCRTERMFNHPDRLPIVVEMILSQNRDERIKALDRIMALQKGDFKLILQVMSGLPVTIRLLDPPLHEFLPSIEQLLLEIQKMETAGSSPVLIKEKRGILEKARGLFETNPMLGHRGVRLGITSPEIYEMQIRAIGEAAGELMKEGVDVRPQIMVPQVGITEEIEAIREIYGRIKSEVEARFGVSLKIKFGTMMEVVRACLVSGEIAKKTEFFSFGTNDLTQGTFSFSREDAENKFLPDYAAKHILDDNPFQVIDEDGVGRLIQLAVQEGNLTNPKLEVGICGEHGGDPLSIDFFHRAGLTYVSTSPYRIPISRLAAAQSALLSKQKK